MPRVVSPGNVAGDRRSSLHGFVTDIWGPAEIADMERIPAKDCRGGLRPPATCYGISRKAGRPGVVSPGSDAGDRRSPTRFVTDIWGPARLQIWRGYQLRIVGGSSTASPGLLRYFEEGRAPKPLVRGAMAATAGRPYGL